MAEATTRWRPSLSGLLSVSADRGAPTVSCRNPAKATGPDDDEIERYKRLFGDEGGAQVVVEVGLMSNPNIEETMLSALGYGRFHRNEGLPAAEFEIGLDSFQICWETSADTIVIVSYERKMTVFC